MTDLGDAVAGLPPREGGWAEPTQYRLWGLQSPPALLRHVAPAPS